MACNTCSKLLSAIKSGEKLPDGAVEIYSSEQALKLSSTSLKPGTYTDEIKNKALKFNGLAIPQPSLQEHIVDGVNVVPPVLIPNGISLPNNLEKKDLPSLKEMAFGLTEAIKENITNAVMNGVLLASEEEKEKRFETCLNCEFLMHKQSRCLKCGCYMNLKTRLKASKCPIGKW